MINSIEPEQLLIAVEDLLRSAPSAGEFQKSSNEGTSWLARVAAVIKQWDVAEYLRFNQAKHLISSGLSPYVVATSYKEIMLLLQQAQHDLRLRTVGPLNVAIEKGRVFDYFEELKGIIEQATSDVLFVDAYLDDSFVRGSLKRGDLLPWHIGTLSNFLRYRSHGRRMGTVGTACAGCQTGWPPAEA